MKIKAKLKNWSRAYGGVVNFVNKDGSLNVTFEDGETIKYLQKRYVVSAEQPAKTKQEEPAKAVEATASKDTVYTDGMKIKAKLKNWSRAYGGVVNFVNKDGSLNVTFEDGETIKYLQKRYVVSVEAPAASSAASSDPNMIAVGSVLDIKLPKWKKSYKARSRVSIRMASLSTCTFLKMARRKSTANCATLSAMKR